MLAFDWLAHCALVSPDKIAIVDTLTQSKITYRQWNYQVNKLAHWLTELGVVKGTRVAILAANSMPYLDTWFACGKTGAILQNLNWRLSATELEILIRHAAPEILIYSSEFIPTIRSLRNQIPSVRNFIAIHEKASENDRHFDERNSRAETWQPLTEITTDDPWVLCYTGGTTGTPKGAILTHGNILWNAIQTCSGWKLHSDDMTLLNAPLFHTGGLNVLTAPLVYAGGTSILCASFDVDQVLDLIATHRVTVLFGVPTMFHLMQENPRWPSADFSSCRFIISGGAPCPMPIFEKFWAKGVDFKTGYGLTEAGPNTFWLPRNLTRQKPGSVGFPLPFVKTRIARPDGGECDADDVGELLIRGPHVSPGYWNQPEATAATIREGWLHTGDLARQDADGCFYIVGRLKEMFISGGENVYPIEIETVLQAHEAIAEAVVIGVPDDKWGEVGWAFVSIKKGYSVSETELTVYLKSKLAGYKIPKKIIFLPSLPKTAVNKIDKKALLNLTRQ